MIISDLPKTIPVFPLSNAIFFPNTVLPLNIFEQKYIQLVDDCMKGQRLFGMIQPRFKSNIKGEVYNVGCLGKIITFNETKDKRFTINLSGVIRFRIKKEIATSKLYREFNVDYSDFISDLNTKKNDANKIKIRSLFQKVKSYLKKKNYLIEFNELEKLSVDQLLSTISMISPFSLEEKQKLIETTNVEEKMIALEEIINFSLFDDLENKTLQ
jgi:Lon protease-like protein